MEGVRGTNPLSSTKKSQIKAARRIMVTWKVSGQTRTEVKERLKALHSELDAGVRTVQGYTVEAAVADCWPRASRAAPPRRSRSTGTRCVQSWQSSAGSRCAT